MADITLQFPDGKQRQFDANATTKDVAQSIAISLAKKRLPVN